MKLPEIRAEDVASLMVMIGLGAQGYGLFAWLGLGVSLVVVGTEIAAMGLVGVVRNAG